MNVRQGAPRSSPLLWMSLCGALSAAIYAGYFLAGFPLVTYYALRGADLARLVGRSAAGAAAFVVAMALLFGLYLVAVRAARGLGSSSPGLMVVLGFALVSGAVLVGVFPVGAADVYGYLFQGRVLAVYGANPFAVYGRMLPGDLVFPYLAWPEETAPYGPLWIWASAGVARLAGDSLLLGLVGFKALALVLHLLCTFALYALLRHTRPAEALAGALLYSWNPLVLFETAVNAHNDVAMAFLAVLAFYAYFTGHLRTCLVLLMASVLVKFTTALLFPVLLLDYLRAGEGRRARLGTLGQGLALAGVLVIGQYGFFWVGPQTIGPLNRGELFSSSLAALALHSLRALSVPDAAKLAVTVFYSLFFTFYLWRLWRLWREGNPLGASFDVLFAYLLLGAIWFMPWYLMLLLPIGAAVGPGWRQTVVIACTATAPGTYLVFNFFWHWFPRLLGQVALQSLSVLFSFGPVLVYPAVKAFRRLLAHA